MKDKTITLPLVEGNDVIVWEKRRGQRVQAECCLFNPLQLEICNIKGRPRKPGQYRKEILKSAKIETIELCWVHKC